MTKLSDLKISAEDEERGEWVFFGGDIYLRLRRTTYPPFQRSVRRMQLEAEPATGAPPLTIEQRVEAEEKETLALHVARGEHILVDWHGWDEEAAEPAELNGEAVRDVLGIVDGKEVERWTCAGKKYRRLDDGRFLEQVPWSRERSVSAMSDHENYVLRENVRYRSELLTLTGFNKLAAVLGKSKSTSSGKQPTGTSLKK